MDGSNFVDWPILCGAIIGVNGQADSDGVPRLVGREASAPVTAFPLGAAFPAMPYLVAAQPTDASLPRYWITSL